MRKSTKGMISLPRNGTNSFEWFRTHRAAPTIEEIQKRLDQLRVNELDSLRTALSEEDFKLVDIATRSLMKKGLTASNRSS